MECDITLYVSFIYLFIFSTVATTTCTALQRLVRSALFLNCSINVQCDTAYCSVTSPVVQSFVSMVNITILPCNQPPTVWILGTDPSGSVVLNHVFNRSENISLTEGVTINGSVLQLTGAIGFEVSVYAEYMYFVMDI